MSHSHSRVEKTEGHLRKSGRSGSFGQHRSFSGDGKGGGGVGSSPAPALSTSIGPPSALPPHNSLANRSSKKSGDGHGGQSRGIAVSYNSDAAHRAGQDVTHSTVLSNGSSDGPAPVTVKPEDPSNNKKITRTIPKAVVAQSLPGAPGSAASSAQGDESGAFLQFGTINPGIVNGMQIPARTCSAPPNLDEQKRDQARQDSFKSVPMLPIPSAPKPQQQQKQQQQLPRKEVGSVGQSKNSETRPPIQEKRDMHATIPPAPPSNATVIRSSNATTIRSSVLPVGGVSMHVPFQQPPIHLQFSAPSSQMPSQNAAASSLQMTMALPAGNVTQVPQQMLVPNVQSHPLQTQSIMHHGQGLGFTPQFGHQVPPQLGSLGINFTPHFPLHQSGNFGNQRRAVKITHPETHEELKLDKRTDSHTDTDTSGQRHLHNVSSQSQPHPTFNPSTQMNYYSGFNHPTLFFPSSSPHLSNSQMSSGAQAVRVRYPNSLNPAPGGRTVPPPPLHGFAEAVRSEGSSVNTSSSTPVPVTNRSSIVLTSEKTGTSSVRISKPAAKSEQRKDSKLYGDASSVTQQKNNAVDLANTVTIQRPNSEPSGSVSSSAIDKTYSAVSPITPSLSCASTVDSLSAMAGNGGWKKEAMQITESTKDHQNRSSKRELRLPQQKQDVIGLVQADALDSTGSMKSHLPKAYNDIDTSESVRIPMSNDCASIPSAPEGDSSTSATRLLSADVIGLVQADALDSTGSMKSHLPKAYNDNDTSESVRIPVSNDCASIPSASEGDSSTSATRLLSADVTCKNSKSVSNTKIMTASGSSVFSLENVGQAADLVEVTGNKLSLKEVGHIQTSSSSNIYASGTVSETHRSNFDGCMTMDFGQKQENLAAAQDLGGEEFDDVLLGSSSAQQCAVSTIGLLHDTPEVENKELEGQIPEEGAGAVHDTSLEPGINSELGRTGVLSKPSTTSSDSIGSVVGMFGYVPSTIPVEDKPLPADSVISSFESTCSEDIDSNEFVTLPPEMISTPPLLSELEQKIKCEVVDQSPGSPRVISGPKEKLEPNRAKTIKKKKKKEILSKADAAGASDLYNAYKGPEEKHETSVSISETDRSCSTEELKSDAAHNFSKLVSPVEEDGNLKYEFQDWEDAADASTPKLRTSDTGDVNQANGTCGKRKYSIDFLLTLSEQCNDLPEGFEIGTEIANVLMNTPAGINRDPHFSPGRSIDGSPGASRGEKRLGGISDDNKWSRVSNVCRMDLSHGTAAMNFRPGQGANNGVLKNPRMQSPHHFASGILSGPMQSLASQGGMTRSNPDTDRWQHASIIQRGLMPAPQGPMQVMHRSSNRYEVGKVSDEEQQKQRRLKAILNKLTPQNFEKLFIQVKEVNIDNALTLSGVISQIFDKALMEPTFCEMYADFCLHLAKELPDFVEDNKKITFRRLLLNKCQEEFERGEIEQAEANKAEEGEVRQTEEEREDKRIRARRRMLGNIRLIGELYKKKMIPESIMHECIKKLLGQYLNPDEEDIEALCKLMSTIGEMIDHSKAKEYMNAYFDMMAKLSMNQKLSSRMRFMLRDTIDLRKNRWQQRRKVEGPKKIEDLHKDAAQERQAQTSRLARGPPVSSRRGPPGDFGHRGSTILNSSSSQANASVRGLPAQTRGFGSQDVRHENRPMHEGRVMPVPLPRPADDGSITLGPQGGLAKGMAGRGPAVMPNVHLAEMSSRAGDPHRLASGSNVFTSERRPSTVREEDPQKYMVDRLSGASNDQIRYQDRNSHFSTRDSSATDHTIDRSSGTTTGFSGGKERESSESKSFSEDAIRKKSISAIREFYSAKDEEEVILCMKDINAPYPCIVSWWVTDSFERKNTERNLLAELLVNISKAGDSLISQTQLIEGFESVLSCLEDAVNDAPKAAEYLGHILGKVVVENVVPLKEIGSIIREGGEEAGKLVKSGLASEVLFVILEFIREEKGVSLLNDILKGSDIRLQEFRPLKPTAKSSKLDAFL